MKNKLLFNEAVASTVDYCSCVSDAPAPYEVAYLVRAVQHAAALLSLYVRDLDLTDAPASANLRLERMLPHMSP